MHKQISSVSLYFAIAILLVICGGVLSDGMKIGLDMCGNVLIPSLFPFMIFSSYLANSQFVSHSAKLFSKLGEWLKIGGEEIAVFLVSMLSGYPSGSAMRGTMTRSGKITQTRASKSVCYCCSAGPAFLVLAVGQGILHNTQSGVILLCSHIFGSVITMLVFSRNSDCTSPINTQSSVAENSIVEAVSNATASMICVCSFVLVFASLGILPERLGFGKVAACIFSCILEVTNGCVRLREITQFLPIYSAVCGFGGLSVVAQCFALCKPISALKFILARLLNSAASFGFCYFFILAFPQAVPTSGAKIEHTTVNPAPLAIALILMCVVFSVSVYSEKNKKIVI